MDRDRFDDLPRVPVRVQTRSGQMVDTQAPIWRVRNYAEHGTLITINWLLFDEITPNGRPVFGARTTHLLKLYLAHRLQTRSPATVGKDVGHLRTFGRWLASESPLIDSLSPWRGFTWAYLDEDLAQAYCDWCLANHAGADTLFASVRTLYTWGVARRLPDFSLRTLKAIKAIVVPNSAKGHYVRFRHVTHGPFSPEELFLIRRELASGRGQSEDRAIIMLHLELGANPSAFCRLVNEDLKRIETEEAVWYQLAVPRLKKRRSEREAKRRPISQRLGNLLTTFQQEGPESRLLHWLSPDHPTDGVRWAMHRWVETVNLISPRTGELLHMRPRRFRYSYATHIAEAGASKYHLAELLDHTDLQSVEVYVETSPAIALTELMCYHMVRCLQVRNPLQMADLTRQEVIKLLATGQRRIRLRGVDLSGLDLSYLDLSDTNLAYANLRQTNLAHANLRGAILCGARLSTAVLRKAILRSADLIDADLSDADLNEADLGHAVLCGAGLAGADLTEARWDGAQFDGARPDAATIWPADFDVREHYLFVADE